MPPSEPFPAPPRADDRVAGELVIANARIVLADEELHGSVLVRDGAVADISPRGAVPLGALDFEGDTLVPGLVDLHTDNLEKHFMPRPGVRWPGVSAVIAHDGQVAAAGVTTVYDALALGASADREERKDLFPDMVEALAAASAAGLLRAEHHLHLRCEVTDPDILTLFERYAEVPLVAFISVMDHSPGQRQFADLDGYRARMLGQGLMTEDALDRHIETRVAQSAAYGDAHRAALAARGRERGLPMASHDDGTEDQIRQSAALGLDIAEFPTTEEAARAARRHAMSVLGGAPNLVRGESYSGNVSVAGLAREGLLDLLASDYVPVSMMVAAFRLPGLVDGFGLPESVRLVTRNPARAAGLDDRGEIAVGRRADLVRVRLVDGLPVVRAVWRRGERVA